MRNNNQRNREINKKAGIRDKNNKKRECDLLLIVSLSLVLEVARSSEEFLGS